jgi:hypothetical protein
VIARFVAAEGAPQPLSQPIVLFISLQAIVTAACALLLPRFYPPDATLRQILESDPAPEALATDPSTGRVDAARLETIRGLSLDERRALQFGRLFSLQALLRAALAEAIVICGFVISFLSRRPEPAFAFAVPSLLVMVLIFPRLAPFMDRWERVRGTGGL